MKANKRIRDLSRRRTNGRILFHCSDGIIRPVTTWPYRDWTEDTYYSDGTWLTKEQKLVPGIAVRP